MGLLDKPLRSVGKLLIDKLGATATIYRKVPGDYRPASGVSAPAVESSTIVKISPPSAATENALATSTSENRLSVDEVYHQDFQTFIAAKGLTIAPIDPATDMLVFQGTTYRIVSVDSLWSGDQVTAYKLIVRR